MSGYDVQLATPDISFSSVYGLMTLP